jgi:hypothetical protein
MAEHIPKIDAHGAREFGARETEGGSEIFSIDDAKKSTWQLVLQYKAAVLWSAFIGLAGINWGMDVLVSCRISQDVNQY